MNSIRLVTGENMQEEVSGARFATLENEVKHITSDVAEIKESTKTTQDSIRSIDLSFAVMAEHVKQNQQMGPRIEKLESKVSMIDKKIAAYAGGVGAIIFIVMQWPKIQAFFG